MDRQRSSQSYRSLKRAECKEWGSSSLSKTRFSTVSSVKLELCERPLNNNGALRQTTKLSGFMLCVNIIWTGQDLGRNVASDDFCEVKSPRESPYKNALNLSTPSLSLLWFRWRSAASHVLHLESAVTQVRSQEMCRHWQNKGYYWWKFERLPPFQMCCPGGLSLSR